MQDHLKFLAVDDIPEWADGLKHATEDYFVNERKFARAKVRGFTAYNATQADAHIAGGGWDLVLLDMNLAEGSARKGARERISGLDLLGDIARGNRAYFVIVVTGAVTDKSLEKFYGRETAALLRFGALNEAVKRMPASRIRILHKPEEKTAEQAMDLLRPQLCSALDQYCSVSLERNLFRALPGDEKLLEICYNGGPRLTLPFDAPFRTIQSALAQPNRMLKVNELIQRLAHSSGKGGAVVLPEDGAVVSKGRQVDADYRGHQGDEVSGVDGLDWEEMDGYGVTGSLHAPADTSEGAIPIETLVGGLLAASGRGLNLEQAIKGIIDMGVEERVLLSIPGVASAWAKDGQGASVEFGIDDASSKLMKLVRELKPVLEPVKARWLKAKAGSEGVTRQKGKKTVRVTMADDTREMELARQHWARFKKKIKARPALSHFYKHIVEWVPRDPSTRGHLYYRPPTGDDLCPFWLTE